MKIKANKTFVSGRYSANGGEVIEVPEVIGAKLVSIGFAEKAQDKAASAAKTTQKVEVGETSTPAKKTAGTGKSAARTTAKK